MIAALFVESNGIYSRLASVDPWDLVRDAKLYKGPHKVIAHPPCKRWGRYWSGGPSVKVRRLKGDDDGCFASALWAVRTYGGVIEHPEASHAWSWFGLARPHRVGGWPDVDQWGGRSCCVEQGHYGHKARKATWLYAVLGDYPELQWGPSEGVRMDEGFHSTAARRVARGKGVAPLKRLSASERLGTPPRFADLLINLVTESPSLESCTRSTPTRQMAFYFPN